MSVLVLVRHGQSQFNLENRFTGWLDVELTEKGRAEAHQAAKLIGAANFKADQAFTSELKRAQNTLKIILDDLKMPVPTTINKALNERHYGDLQGKNKAETAAQFGEEQVKIWRRSFDVPPPGGESLKDTAARTIPYFNSAILPLLKNQQNVLVAAHGNSLRSIVMSIQNLTPEQILKTEIGTGEAWFYNVSPDGICKRI